MMIELIADTMYSDGLQSEIIEGIMDLAQEDDEAFELMLKWQRYSETRLELEQRIWEFLRQRAKI